MKQKKQADSKISATLTILWVYVCVCIHMCVCVYIYVCVCIYLQYIFLHKWNKYKTEKCL